MALVVLGALGYAYIQNHGGSQKPPFDAQREDRSYWGQRNPTSQYHRGYARDSLLDRPYDMSDQVNQRVVGSVHDAGRGHPGAHTTYATIESAGVAAETPDTMMERQELINDMWNEDLPLRGYSAGARQNWHIDARSRGRPAMYEGVGVVDVPRKEDTETGIGEWPIVGTEGTGAIFGYRPGAAPREFLFGGPVSLGVGSYHRTLMRGDFRPYEVNEFDYK